MVRPGLCAHRVRSQQKRSFWRLSVLSHLAVRVGDSSASAAPCLQGHVAAGCRAHAWAVGQCAQQQLKNENKNNNGPPAAAQKATFIPPAAPSACLLARPLPNSRVHDLCLRLRQQLDIASLQVGAGCLVGWVLVLCHLAPQPQEAAAAGQRH